MILIGNKIDLNREVTTEEGKKLAEIYNIPFFETSAKDNIGLRECFIKLISDILIDFHQSEEGIKLDIKNKSGNNDNNNKFNICSC